MKYGGWEEIVEPFITIIIIIIIIIIAVNWFYTRWNCYYKHRKQNKILRGLSP
jgi:hypothetical protein